MRRLYLFTARFPYNGAENFLEDEILFLSKKFDLIYIVPFKDSGLGIRNIPENCFVYPPIVRDNFDYISHGLFCLRSFVPLIKEFFDEHVYTSTKRIKVWCTAYIASSCTLRSKSVKKIKKQILPTDVCYFYWGKWSNILSYFWNGKAYMVSRFHGEWDLWEENFDGYAPLRKNVSRSLTTAVFISQKGAQYFNNKYSSCSTRVFRLGSKDIGVSKKSEDGILRIISCSTVYPLKRVDLILKSVAAASLNKRIVWTHIGGGRDFEKIKKMSEEYINDNFTPRFIGQMDYMDVLKFYQRERFDIFINLSTNEGVPVSIMEAISCNIPVVATDVGGNAEIVSEVTGKLVSKNPTESEVSAAILEVYNNITLYTPRSYWEKYYNASKNYEEFTNFLCNPSIND